MHTNAPPDPTSKPPGPDLRRHLVGEVLSSSTSRVPCSVVHQEEQRDAQRWPQNRRHNHRNHGLDNHDTEPRNHSTRQRTRSRTRTDELVTPQCVHTIRTDRLHVPANFVHSLLNAPTTERRVPDYPSAAGPAWKIRGRRVAYIAPGPRGLSAPSTAASYGPILTARGKPL